MKRLKWLVANLALTLLVASAILQSPGTVDANNLGIALRWPVIEFYNGDNWDNINMVAADFNGTDLTATTVDQCWTQSGKVVISTMSTCDKIRKQSLGNAIPWTFYNYSWKRCFTDAGVLIPGICTYQAPGSCEQWDRRVVYGTIKRNVCSAYYGDLSSNPFYTQHIATHEAGHVVGLGHVFCESNIDSVMNAPFGSSCVPQSGFRYALSSSYDIPEINCLY